MNNNGKQTFGHRRAHTLVTSGTRASITRVMAAPLLVFGLVAAAVGAEEPGDDMRQASSGAAVGGESEVRLAFHPYEGVDWETVQPYKMELHAHVRNAYDEVADLIRLFTGEGEDRRGHRLAPGDAYHIPAVSYGTGPACRYWPWEDLSSFECWTKDFDAEANGVVGLPVVEIDDVRHFNALFSYGLPNDVSDDFPPYRGWREAIDVVIRDTRWTVVDGDANATPLLLPAHPARYYDNPKEDGLAAYREPFEKHSLADGLVGIEALTKAWDPWRDHAGESNAERWDDVILAGLLMDLPRREGPVLMFAGDDPNQHRIGHDIDRRWTWVLLEPEQFDPADQDASRRAIYEAIRAGRILACQRVPWDHSEQDPPAVPVVRAVEVDEANRTITVRAEGGRVVWVNAHVAASGDPDSYLKSVVAEGVTFDYGAHAEVVAGSHIIPHVIGPDGRGETLLQPFTFE